ncbi:glutathione S-transferase family protein [Xenorhabdus sp. 12]|uniref:Glutathione S-transferase family protein n=1 Tax=Xenorhabdus santafensis TaxID=2582833 RepID=A0ABU4S575_9GAMM|nr:glutathione S-transferase family protein [Xenorhabdus sp. 12]MDX7986367.1 glutathione S-transferase family protein [Xenorhabdus sp. 12]
MNQPYTLFGCQNCGSTIVAAALQLTGLAWNYEEADYDVDSPARDRLFALNPLGQVPTLVLPNNEIMTESAAIILWLHEQAPQAKLVPSRGSSLYPYFLRWLMFINTAIYPTFTYGDFPAKWLPQNTHPEQLEEGISPHRQKLWLQLASASSHSGPWFLGENFSALDLYITVMCNWKPGRSWFKQHCPKLIEVAERVENMSELNALLCTDFSQNISKP